MGDAGGGVQPGRRAHRQPREAHRRGRLARQDLRPHRRPRRLRSAWQPGVIRAPPSPPPPEYPCITCALATLSGSFSADFSVHATAQTKKVSGALVRGTTSAWHCTGWHQTVVSACGIQFSHLRGDGLNSAPCCGMKNLSIAKKGTSGNSRVGTVHQSKKLQPWTRVRRGGGR